MELGAEKVVEILATGIVSLVVAMVVSMAAAKKEVPMVASWVVAASAGVRWVTDKGAVTTVVATE